MLAIHYSPVKNTKQILRQGISKSDKGTFCFPMTGNPYVDKFWAQAFRAWRPRTQYNGFVFRLTESDFPAAFGHWLGGASEKPFQSIAGIENAWRESLLFRIGERAFGYSPAITGEEWGNFQRVGAELVAENPRLYTSALDSSPEFLAYVFEDYQLVLSHSIAAKRILRIIPGSNQSGRNIARAKKAAYFTAQIKEI